MYVLSKGSKIWWRHLRQSISIISIFKPILFGLLSTKGSWYVCPENGFHVRIFFQFTASNIERRGLERAVELLVANKDEDEGQNRQWDQKDSEDELLDTEIAQHRDLVQDQGSHDACVDMRPYFPIGVVFRNQHFKSLLIRRKRRIRLTKLL